MNKATNTRESLQNYVTSQRLNMSNNSSEIFDDTFTHLCSLLKYREPIVNGSSFYRLLLWPLFIVNIVFAPVAVTANALILMVIWRTSSLRTPSYLLLGGLAFIHCCTGLIIQPFEVERILGDITGNRPLFCLGGVFIVGAGTYFIGNIAVTITVMSVERWMYMSRRSLLTVKRVCLLYIVLMVVPIPFAILYLQSSRFYKRVAIYAGTCLGLICFIITLVAYFKVFQMIRRHQSQVAANQSVQNSNQPSINLEKYKKSVLTILYTIILIVLGYFPSLAWAITWSFVTIDKSAEIVMSHFCYTVLFATSSLNPLLYCWRMKDISNGVKKLIKRILCWHNVNAEAEV